MKNGFKLPPKAEQIKQLATEMSNTQTAVRMSQMMTQQLLSNMKKMQEDLGHAFNQLHELQYKYLSLQRALNVDVATLDLIANEQRLKDFNEAAENTDTREGLLPSESVNIDSVITLTSVAKDQNGKDCGIFRSRLKLSECGVPDLIKSLTDQKVGFKTTTLLNGISHEIELLSIKNPPLVPIQGETPQ